MLKKLYINKFGTHTNNQEEAFLVRTIICRNRFFNIFIHRFLKSDPETLHDHPWNFLSFIIRGSYIEEIESNGNRVYLIRSASNRRLAFRKATMFHRIKLFKQYSYRNAPITLCVTFNRQKSWNYLTETGPVKWRKYLKHKR